MKIHLFLPPKCHFFGPIFANPKHPRNVNYWQKNGKKGQCARNDEKTAFSSMDPLGIWTNFRTPKTQFGHIFTFSSFFQCFQTLQNWHFFTLRNVTFLDLIYAIFLTSEKWIFWQLLCNVLCNYYDNFELQLPIFIHWKRD